MSETAPSPRPAKKGLGPFAWVLIGCGSVAAIAAAAVLVLGVFVANKVKDVAEEFDANPAMAAAEMIVRFNPELELVQKDAAAQTLTVRNTKTGKVVTVDVNAIREGKISFEDEQGTSSIQLDPENVGATVVTPEGSTTIGGAGTLLPWIPRYPGAQYRQIQRSVIPQGIITLFNMRSTDPAEKVLAFYRQQYEKMGFEVRRAEVPGAESTIFAVAPDRKSKINISITDLGEGGCAGMLRANEANEGRGGEK